MSWNAEFQGKLRENLEGLDKYVAYRQFKFFENVRFGISISQHYIPEPIKKCADIFSS
jgi:hypothetical protein